MIISSLGCQSNITYQQIDDECWCLYILLYFSLILGPGSEPAGPGNCAELYRTPANLIQLIIPDIRCFTLNTACDGLACHTEPSIAFHPWPPRFTATTSWKLPLLVSQTVPAMPISNCLNADLQITHYWGLILDIYWAGAQ
jgi:hypothetical protein